MNAFNKFEISVFIGMTVAYLNLIFGNPYHAIVGLLIFILIVLMVIMDYMRIK